MKQTPGGHQDGVWPWVFSKRMTAAHAPLH